MKAIRFNVNRGSSEDISRELYIDSNSLTEITTIVEKLPSVSIDHLGLSKSGFTNLLSLVDKGVRVKATGFGRIDFDAEEAIRTIYSTNPDVLMFGTDLPSTREKRPFRYSDIELINNILKEEEAKKVFYKNALNWYLKVSV